MNSSEVVERQIQVLETELSILFSQWEVFNDDLRRSQLDKEMHEKLSNIDKLKNTLNNPHQLVPSRVTISNIILAKIDFRTARGQINAQCEILENEGGFLSLIVQNTSQYKGDLLIEEIRDRFKSGKPKFRSVTISLKLEGWSDFQGLLACIANKLNITVEDASLTPQYLIENLIQQCDSGTTFFFELIDWAELEDIQFELLARFYQDIWMPLITKKSLMVEKFKKVRFISIISDRGSLDEGCFNLSCPITPIIKVDLNDWTEDEIRDWLTDYTFLSGTELTREARRIFRGSNGIPVGVYSELIQRFDFI